MTNKEAKQQVIKKAYGEHWGKVKEYVDEYGRLTYQQCTDIFGDNEFYFCGISNLWKNDFEGHYAPEVVFDLCRNNGWIRIEPDGSNLPEENESMKSTFKVFDITDIEEEDMSCLMRASSNAVHQLFKQRRITHYKPITPELKPIY